eukprot:TRINITY_DN14463_c0_g1_i2.p1 TRINITY_DN14463_c0_g1~~TRINITY_DN14463_c0_g1_i2.p1  ORF type:complete len:786 (+),score=163.35 TRINITY_DN14463_c0_g1_i2:46-2403(+)
MDSPGAQQAMSLRLRTVAAVLAAVQLGAGEEDGPTQEAAGAEGADSATCPRIFAVPGPNQTVEEWQEVKSEAQGRVLELLQRCADSKEPADAAYHVEALHRQSFVFFDKERPALAVGVLRRAAGMDQSLNSTWRLAVALSQRMGRYLEAEEAAAGGLVSLASGSVASAAGGARGEEPAADAWAQVQHCVSELPLRTNLTECMQYDQFAPLLIQELVSALRRRHAVSQLRGALRTALRLSPYNFQLRRVVLQFSGQIGDIWACWMAHAQPAGMPDTAAEMPVQLYLFFSELNRVIVRLAQSLVPAEDTDGTWSAGVRQSLQDLCGVDIAIHPSHGVRLADLRAAVATCMEKQGVLRDWERIAASLDPPLPVLELLGTKAGEIEPPVTPLHAAATLGLVVLRAAVGGAELTPQPAGLHRLTPAHAAAAAGAAPDAAAATAAEPAADEWGRTPGEEGACWEQPGGCGSSAEGSAFAAAQAKDAPDPAKEWSRKDLTSKATPPGGWLSWQAPEWLLDLSERCDLPFVKGMTRVAFIRDHLAVGHPAVLHSALGKKARKEQAKTLAFAHLARVLGGALIPVGTVHHLERVPFAEAEQATTALAAFAFEHMHKGSNETLEGPMRGPFKEAVAIPPAVQALRATRNISAFSFRVGGGGAGRGLFFGAEHRLDFLHSGRRVWALLPPDRAHFSAQEPLDALEFASQEDGALVCQQFSGDALYIPPGWAAAAVNLRESVGWEAEFPWGLHQLQHAEPAPAKEVPLPEHQAGGGAPGPGGGSVTIGTGMGGGAEL